MIPPAPGGSPAAPPRRDPLERPPPAFPVEGGAMIPRAADGSDAEPLGCDRVELTVAMPGDQHLGAVARLVLDERCQQMLAVPERKNRRHLRLDDVVDIRR